MQKKETAKSNKTVKSNKTAKRNKTAKSIEIEFSKDFLDFFVLLNENKVEYMLIGGYAVSFYGYPRFTGSFKSSERVNK